MHRSRLTSALVDVPPAAWEREVAFWSGALGRPPEVVADEPDYADFGEQTPGLRLMVQRVDDPARVHLDVETDDVDAEVARLERLGAVRVEKVQTWWVLRDPAGLLFCVVRVQSPEAFAAHASTWDDDGQPVPAGG